MASSLPCCTREGHHGPLRDGYVPKVVHNGHQPNTERWKYKIWVECGVQKKYGVQMENSMNRIIWEPYKCFFLANDIAPSRQLESNSSAATPSSK